MTSRTRRNAGGSAPELREFLRGFPDAALPLLETRGAQVIERLGVQTVREVLLDVLCGINLRASTELLTRRRIALLNAATVVLFMRAQIKIPNFVDRLYVLAADGLHQEKLSRGERWLLQWTLGLTDKAFQNVLRDDTESIAVYSRRVAEVVSEAATYSDQEFGSVIGKWGVVDEGETALTWPFLIALLGAVGSQTLTIRGSEKALYGKMFEKLVLVAVLEILGYRLVSNPGGRWKKRVFWLTSMDEKRESDATLLHDAGQGVRFDIGFIGRGNPEISLDKVSRFERVLASGHGRSYMGTIIIVDRIGHGSRIVQHAQSLGGSIVQMSMQYWPKQVAVALQEMFPDFDHEIMRVPDAGMREYLASALGKVSAERLAGQVEIVAAEEDLEP